jgi:hypothetical protein
MVSNLEITSKKKLLILLNASNTYKMCAFRIIAKGLSFINLSKNIEPKKTQSGREHHIAN